MFILEFVDYHSKEIIGTAHYSNPKEISSLVAAYEKLKNGKSRGQGLFSNYMKYDIVQFNGDTIYKVYFLNKTTRRRVKREYS